MIQEQHNLEQSSGEEEEQEFTFSSYGISQNEHFINSNFDEFLKSCKNPTIENSDEEEGQLLIKREALKGQEIDKEVQKLLAADIKGCLGLVKDIKQIIVKIRIQLNELLDRQTKEGSVEGGISLIRVRLEVLIDYSRYLTLLAIMKMNGETIEGHPIIMRLVWLKTFLTRLKPLNKKLEYQIGKQIRLAIKSQLKDRNTIVDNSDDEDGAENAAGGQLDIDLDEGDEVVSQDLDSDDDNDQDKNLSSKRRERPTYMITSMKDRTRIKTSSKQDKKQKRFDDYRKKQLLESREVRELTNEMEDRPRELATGANIGGVFDRMEQKRRKGEEESMQRRYLTKEQKQMIQKRLQRLKKGEKVDDMDSIKQLGELARLENGEVGDYKLKMRGKQKKQYLQERKKMAGWGRTMKDSEVDKQLLTRKNQKFRINRKTKKSKGRKKGAKK